MKRGASATILFLLIIILCIGCTARCGSGGSSSSSSHSDLYNKSSTYRSNVDSTAKQYGASSSDVDSVINALAGALNSGK